jgi:hypothetical protein
MPTIMRVGPFRLFFYSADGGEPAHIHIEREGRIAKVWLDPVRTASTGGFSRSELREIERLVNTHKAMLLENGMAFSPVETDLPDAVSAIVDERALRVDLSDGRSIAVPLTWYPRLAHATVEERANWRLIGAGEGLHWPDLDEDISVAALLTGKSSTESPASLKRWLATRREAR